MSQLDPQPETLWRLNRSSLILRLLRYRSPLQIGAGEEDGPDWVISVVVAGLLAGVRAAFKLLRERVGQGDYDKLIYKVPA